MATLTDRVNERIPSDQNSGGSQYQFDRAYDQRGDDRQRSARYTQQRRPRRQANSRDRCHGCGNFGHFRRECTQHEQSLDQPMTNRLRNTDRAVGGCPVADVTIGGVNAHGIIDTGSEVTTVTESWLQEHFPQTKPAYLNWLRLKGAHGLDITYNGVIEVTLTIGTQTLTDTMVLVVKDSDDVETRDRKKQLPVVLGMNVLRKIENFLKRMRSFVDFSVCYACSEIEQNIGPRNCACSRP